MEKILFNLFPVRDGAERVFPSMSPAEGTTVAADRWSDAVEAVRKMFVADASVSIIRVFIGTDLGDAMKAVDGFPNERFRICSAPSISFPYRFFTDMTHADLSRYLGFRILGQKVIRNDEGMFCGLAWGEFSTEPVLVDPGMSWEKVVRIAGTFREAQSLRNPAYCDRIVVRSPLSVEGMRKTFPDFPPFEDFILGRCSEREVFSRAV